MKRISWLLLCVALASCARTVPDFTLQDQDGHVFHLSQVRGKAVAVFFGYAHCTDVCPTTLLSLARAKKMLGADGSRAAVLFITVDPARDTPSQLKSFVHTFDPTFIGLTGTAAQLTAVDQKFHVWYQRLPSLDGKNYAVGHSSSITFLHPDGSQSSIGDWTDQARALSVDFKNALQ